MGWLERVRKVMRKRVRDIITGWAMYFNCYNCMLSIIEKMIENELFTASKGKVVNVDVIAINGEVIIRAYFNKYKIKAVYVKGTRKMKLKNIEIVKR